MSRCLCSSGRCASRLFALMLPQSARARGAQTHRKATMIVTTDLTFLKESNFISIHLFLELAKGIEPILERSGFCGCISMLCAPAGGLKTNSESEMGVAKFHRAMFAVNSGP